MMEKVQIVVFAQDEGGSRSFSKTHDLGVLPPIGGKLTFHKEFGQAEIKEIGLTLETDVWVVKAEAREDFATLSLYLIEAGWNALTLKR